MVTLRPAEPDWRDGSHAERALWESLRDALPADAALLHEVVVRYRHGVREADLLVVLPHAGWAVLEVKGGQVRRREGGWEQRTPDGWLPVDPRRQAEDARHEVRRHLHRHGAAHLADAPSVSLVAFPHVSVGDGSWRELDRRCLLDQGDVTSAAAHVLDALRGVRERAGGGS